MPFGWRSLVFGWHSLGLWEWTRSAEKGTIRLLLPSLHSQLHSRSYGDAVLIPYCLLLLLECIPSPPVDSDEWDVKFPLEAAASCQDWHVFTVSQTYLPHLVLCTAEEERPSPTFLVKRNVDPGVLSCLQGYLDLGEHPTDCQTWNWPAVGIRRLQQVVTLLEVEGALEETRQVLQIYKRWAPGFGYLSPGFKLGIHYAILFAGSILSQDLSSDDHWRLVYSIAERSFDVLEGALERFASVATAGFTLADLNTGNFQNTIQIYLEFREFSANSTRDEALCLTRPLARLLLMTDDVETLDGLGLLFGVLNAWCEWEYDQPPAIQNFLDVILRKRLTVTRGDRDDSINRKPSLLFALAMIYSRNHESMMERLTRSSAVWEYQPDLPLLRDIQYLCKAQTEFACDVAWYLFEKTFRVILNV